MVDAAGPRPPLSHNDSTADLSQVLYTGWGVSASLVSLGSLHDQVFLVGDDAGPCAVVKLSTVDRVDEQVLAAEAAALRHLTHAWPSLQLPLLTPGVDDAVLQYHRTLVARMMAWVGGVALTRASHWTIPTIEALGAISGRMSQALSDFDHPGLRRHVEWDPRHAVEVVTGYLSDVTASERDLLNRALQILIHTMPAPDCCTLPQQAVHLDLTDHNVLGNFDSAGCFSPHGVIDFGDLAWSWRVCELAVSVHAAIGRHPDDPLTMLVPVVKGFLRHQELTSTEVDALWTLVLARATICAAAEAAEAVRSPDNIYVHDLAALDHAALQAILAVHAPLAHAVIRTTCGLTSYPVDIAERLRHADPVPIIAADDVTPGLGWLELSDITGEDADPAAPDALRLGSSFTVTGAALVRAPLAGRVHAVSATTVMLACPLDEVHAVYARIEGLTPTVAADGIVIRGQTIGTTGTPDDHEGGRLYVQLGVDPDMPVRGKVRDRSVWKTLCPDPGILVGAASAPTPPNAHLQRQRHVAAAQRTYYEAPLEIVRAHGQWMYDHTGRRYLDMVNNVAIVGHSHPRITEAAAQQLSLLNTNSRFLYRAIADYADRIAETLPTDLGSIFFVNSGSEAVELALQLARQYTTRHDVIALEGSYHGWTTETFALCTMPGDRPRWRQELAPHVHIADCPDWYRGPHAADTGAYLTSLSDACIAAESRGGVAAFVHEPIFGSRGGVIPTSGYLPAAYDVVRHAGGVCVADEVQVGYGRIGPAFWAFADQGVTPDIVAAAKAAGNGHPLGFVACRSEIADAFAAESSFFSTPAGNPVSCRIGTTVLEILHAERLPHNAAAVGDHLTEKLSALGAVHREVGAVYGRGLYQGIDLITGDDTRTPLPATDVDAICERFRELGCIVQPTGLYGNVLKVKPPLCIQRDDADRFIAAMDQILTEREEFRTLASPGPAPSTPWKTHD